MKKNVLTLCTALLLFCGCASETSQPGERSKAAPSGTWSGDYEVAPDRRESISVDLRWEGVNLGGVVQAGFRSLPITKASFNPDTGDVTIEFDAQGPGGRTVRYVVEGKVNGDSMSGSWTHDNQRGSFRVTKE